MDPLWHNFMDPRMLDDNVGETLASSCSSKDVTVILECQFPPLCFKDG